MSNVTFSRVAFTEYQAALAWHVNHGPQTGLKFDRAVDHAVNFLTSFPEAFAPCDATYRHCPLRHFSYGLIYDIDGNEVRVVAVAQDRQHAGFWAGRS